MATKITWNRANISVEFIANRCSALDAAYKNASLFSEYGVDWDTWLSTSNKVDGISRSWWESLVVEEQLMYLTEYKIGLEGNLAAVNASIKEVNNA